LKIKEKCITLRFYAELNDFLAPGNKGKETICSFSGSPTVKDIIESQGVPHTEVDLILANGGSVDFAYHVQRGDFISVYPEFELLDIHPVNRLRPQPLRNMAFIADAHLGKLAAYLRMIGFDTVYRNDLHDEEIIERSRREKRVILTRDLAILKNGKVSRGYFIRSRDPLKQCREVLEKFSLKDRIRPFSRCMECNAHLHSVEKDKIAGRIPELTNRYFTEFYQCRECGRIYWKGSHYKKMQTMIDDLISD
jgi:uncharacterized protein with PIN domain